MKNEKQVVTIVTILNLLISLAKLITGFVLQFSSLIADGLHSLSDFVTDIISMIAKKIGKKRATKRYPFGYGLIENIANLFIGILLFCLATWIFIESFHSKSVVTTLILFIVLITTVLAKLFVCFYLYKSAKEQNSKTLMVSFQESSTDLISSIIVLIVSILLLFKEYLPLLEYSNQVGSIIISIIIYKTSFFILLENIYYLLGKTESDKEVITKIMNYLKEIDTIKDCEVQLVRQGDYFSLFLDLELDPNIRLKKVFRLKQKIRKELKNKKLKIRFIEFDIKPYEK